MSVFVQCEAEQGQRTLDGARAVGGGSALFTGEKNVVYSYTAGVYRNVQLEGIILDNKWLDMKRGSGV
jgi:hypothetical protein